MAAPKFQVTRISDDPGSAFKEAVNAWRERVPMTEEEYETLEDAAKSKAFTVAGVAQADMVQHVFDLLDDAIEKGTTIDDFKEAAGPSLESEWGGPIPGRLELIFRNATQQANNGGRWKMMHNPHVLAARPYLQYDDVDDKGDRECDECHACHGVVLPADDPWWRSHHPQLHHGCRCQVRNLSREEAEHEGIDKKGPSVDVDDGFGTAPDDDVGQEWVPDTEEYDPEIREDVKSKVGR